MVCIRGCEQSKCAQCVYLPLQRPADLDRLQIVLGRPSLRLQKRAHTAFYSKKMRSRLSLWFYFVTAVLVLLSDIRVIEGVLSLQIIPSGNHVVLFDTEVRVSCRFSQKTSSVHAQWHINDQMYTTSSTFPEGIQLAFSNTSSAQLLIHSFGRDLDSTTIRCSVLESPIDGRVYSGTVTLQGTDVLPSSSTAMATTMASTTTAVTMTTDATEVTTPKPTSDPTTVPSVGTQQPNTGDGGTGAASFTSATRLVVCVSLIVSIGLSFVLRQNVIF